MISREQIEAWRTVWNTSYKADIPEFSEARTQLNQLCDLALITRPESVAVYGVKSTAMPKAPSVSVSTQDKSYLVFHRGLWYVFERAPESTAAPDMAAPHKEKS